MRLHTNAITEAQIHAATTDLPGVYATVSHHGSRSHERAFEVSLEGNGYARNSGNAGAGYETGATWDEWGVFIARLYGIDRIAMWGSKSYPVYQDAESFHTQTDDRFQDGTMPSDTHKRHHWTTDYPRTPLGVSQCSKCTAVQRRPV